MTRTERLAVRKKLLGNAPKTLLQYALEDRANVQRVYAQTRQSVEQERIYAFGTVCDRDVAEALVDDTRRYAGFRAHST